MVIYQKQYDWPMDENKSILNDAALEKIALIYQPLIMEIKDRYLDNARGRIHSLYLTGSVVRGKAIPYKSDVNFYAILKQNDLGKGLEWVDSAEQELRKNTGLFQTLSLSSIFGTGFFQVRWGVFLMLLLILKPTVFVLLATTLLRKSLILSYLTLSLIILLFMFNLTLKKL